MLDVTSPTEAHADARLRREPIIWLSTTRPDGRPHLVPVWFWWDGETVLVFSKPDQKVRNLRQTPHVMLALDSAEQGEDIVMLRGVATLLDEPISAVMSPAYAEKYAALLREIGSSAERMAAEYTQPIRIRPTKYLVW